MVPPQLAHVSEHCSRSPPTSRFLGVNTDAGSSCNAAAAVWRIFTALLFHVNLLHVCFNMLVFVPIASSLEHDKGTIQVQAVVYQLGTR